MANNRLVFVCTHCHTGISIGKYYPVSMSVSMGLEPGNGLEVKEEAATLMNQFIGRHLHADELDIDTFEGPVHFAADFESPSLLEWEYEHLKSKPPELNPRQHERIAKQMKKIGGVKK